MENRRLIRVGALSVIFHPPSSILDQFSSNPYDPCRIPRAPYKARLGLALQLFPLGFV
jgi:hypothetical protein